MIKKYIKIIVTLMISIIIILSPCSSRAEDTKDDDEEQHLFTIEEIIFNKIPALNVNVFNTSDAGEDSITMKIRNAVAIWYVAFRNVSLIFLAFVIVYIGIRMAIATVASEKANYKKMLLNWVTAVIIVLFVHFIMLFVFYINDALIEVLSNANESADEPIYETIKTRSKDLRFSIGFPAAIMYVVLFIYSLMFLWTYLKRLFTVLILIILAPLVAIKYAVDGAGKGQRSKIFMTWTYEFSMNVLIQPVHALLYVVLMHIAIDLATKSVLGFILALVFINFIQKADKIFMAIFHFDRSNMIKDVAKPEGSLKDKLTGFYFVQGVAKDAVYTTKKAVKTTIGGAKKVGSFIYNGIIPTTVKETIGDMKDTVTKKKNSVLNKVDENLNSVHKKIRRGKDSNYLMLKIMSRRKDSTGKAAKRTLKTYRKNMKSKFTAPFKFIAKAGGSVIMVGLSLPVTVVKPTAGLNMFILGTDSLHSMATTSDKNGNKYTGAQGLAQAVTLGAYGTYKEQSKSSKRVGATVSYLNQVATKEDEIQKSFSKRFAQVPDEAVGRYQKEVKFYINHANKDNINRIVRQGLADERIDNINDSNVDLVITSMANKVYNDLEIEKNYSKKEANQIIKKMIENAENSYDMKKESGEKFNFGAEDLSQSFSEAIKEKGISDELNSKYLKKTMDRILQERNIESINASNINEVVNQFTNTIMNDLNLRNRINNSIIERDIFEEISKSGKEILSKYDNTELGKQHGAEKENGQKPENRYGAETKNGKETEQEIKDKYGAEAKNVRKAEQEDRQKPENRYGAEPKNGKEIEQENRQKPENRYGAETNNVKETEQETKDKYGAEPENGQKPENRHGAEPKNGKEIEQENRQETKDKYEAEEGIKNEIINKIEKIIRKNGEKAGIDFGYRDITEGIEELHAINKKAQKDINSSVVNENSFIDSLQKNNRFR